MHNYDATDEDLDVMTSLFSVLCDKTRVRLIMILVGGERNVTMLVGLLRLPQPTVSHHLGLLKLHKMIAGHRVGKEVFYALADRVVRHDGTVIGVNAGKYDIEISLAKSGVTTTTIGKIDLSKLPISA